jgi:hypothetical protein
MHVLPRRLGLALTGVAAAVALAVPMADQASAATTTVKIQSDATGSQRLNRLGTAVPRMITAIGTSSKWLRTDTSSGYATYRSVTQDVCLTGRQSLQGLNVVTVEKCVPGSFQQQWRLGVARDFQLRLNGLSAEVNLANPDRPLRMALFTGKPHQKFTITPA